jgi:hypothetical protein
VIFLQLPRVSVRFCDGKTSVRVQTQIAKPLEIEIIVGITIDDDLLKLACFRFRFVAPRTTRNFTHLSSPYRSLQSELSSQIEES